jgi:choline kinase
MRMIVLAAGQGTRLRPLTDDRPKCLVRVAGRPLLEWQLESARRAGITDVVLVGGYRSDQLECVADTRLILNPAFATTNMVRTLFAAEKDFGDAFVMAYGDIAYSPRVMQALLSSTAPVAVVVDRDWLAYWTLRGEDPLADAESLRIDGGGAISSIGQRETDVARIEAQYIGLVAFRGSGVQVLRSAFQRAVAEDALGVMPFGGSRSLDRLHMTDLLQGLVSLGHRLEPVSIDGGWVEIDSAADLLVAESLIASGRLADS